ncbi:hypothetical protein VTK73DRAFT_5005 [Phialemonium thermophilum]|uniref:EIF-2B GDP-GTP exchange factor subunit alpha n=1 Tax=Phialemonium thermophilum TaxID=223376 RepID=A0ABR3V5A7_9PEZI
MAFVGTEVVVQNGGLLSRMGTFQLATLCRAANTPFYVAAETHKIVRLFPLGQADLPRCGVQQDVLDFRTSEDEGTSRQVVPGQIPVDYTPPALISAIITEQGIKLPAAVYSMLLDIYT